MLTQISTCSSESSKNLSRLSLLSEWQEIVLALYLGCISSGRFSLTKTILCCRKIQCSGFLTTQ
ncbi:hypothetical protein AVEN_222991-1, partial [Araneus ventricosus]